MFSWRLSSWHGKGERRGAPTRITTTVASLYFSQRDTEPKNTCGINTNLYLTYVHPYIRPAEAEAYYLGMAGLQVRSPLARDREGDTPGGPRRFAPSSPSPPPPPRRLRRPWRRPGRLRLLQLSQQLPGLPRRANVALAGWCAAGAPTPTQRARGRDRGAGAESFSRLSYVHTYGT